MTTGELADVTTGFTTGVTTVATWGAIEGDADDFSGEVRHVERGGAVFAAAIVTAVIFTALVVVVIVVAMVVVIVGRGGGGGGGGGVGGGEGMAKDADDEDLFLSSSVLDSWIDIFDPDRFDSEWICGPTESPAPADPRASANIHVSAARIVAAVHNG